jgi:hypothetical protein
VGFRDAHACFIASRAGGETIRFSIVGGRKRNGGGGGEQDGLRDSHELLVRDQLFVEAIEVADVLVNVDDAFEGFGLRGRLLARTTEEGRAGGSQGGSLDEFSTAGGFHSLIGGWFQARLSWTIRNG